MQVVGQGMGTVLADADSDDCGRGSFHHLMLQVLGRSQNRTEIRWRLLGTCLSRGRLCQGTL